jgi:hypothetical protein
VVTDKVIDIKWMSVTGFSKCVAQCSSRRSCSVAGKRKVLDRNRHILAISVVVV